MNPLTDLSYLSSLLRAGELTASEATKLSLAEIEKNRTLNAFISVHRDAALRRARRLDADGPPPSKTILWGVPVAIKDNIDEAGASCSVGSEAYVERTPERDAEVVTILEKAGAVIVGRTNMHELADGVTSENPYYGPVHNPHRRGFHPGGSSGGSAVAVAAGCVPVALGTDTGGSVRIPASLCGAVGFKPTRGRISTEGVFPLSTTLDHVGPIASDVFGAEALFFLLAGGDEHRPPAPEPSPSARRPAHPPPPLRLGLLEGFGLPPEAGVQQAFDRACDLLAGLGHTLTKVEIPDLARGISILASIYGPEAARIHAARLTEAPHLFGDEAKRNLERGAARPKEKYDRALARASSLEAAVESALEDLDFFVCPTTPYPARPFGSPSPHEYLTYTCPFNITGQPAISIPMGQVGDLPVGLQIIGKKGTDHALLSFAGGCRTDLRKALEETKGPARVM
jgi:aspartyl-tRNA(Asn)/glutamyl-tRNA(Gln) amidotransferase subunit A